MVMVRQGDVLLVPVETAPEDARPVSSDGGAVVLALGEATGHAHVIRNERATLVAAKGAAEVFLVVRGQTPVTLSHEEHHALPVAPGAYRVVRQREYEPGPLASRLVAD